jgi:hypothetical protein
MDTVVPFDDVTSFLRNPPTMHPCPDFAKLHALCLHLVKALKLIKCPQSSIHGWSGLAMAPAVYAPLEPNAFVVPADPGPAPIYISFAMLATIKMVNATFKQDKNYFMSYKNIYHACFRMLYKFVPNQYKVLNMPVLLVWNTTMSIQFILNQMEDAYGKPLAAVLFSNDTLFKSPFAATEAPKSLFYHMEQCQEIMTLGNLPYTPAQVIANALCLLMASTIFPNREFET